MSVKKKKKEKRKGGKQVNQERDGVDRGAAESESSNLMPASLDLAILGLIYASTAVFFHFFSLIFEVGAFYLYKPWMYGGFGYKSRRFTCIL